MSHDDLVDRVLELLQKVDPESEYKEEFGECKWKQQESFILKNGERIAQIETLSQDYYGDEITLRVLDD